VIIIALSYVISQDISCKLVTEVSGSDNKVKTSNNYEFLSFDNRKVKMEENNATPGVILA